MSLSDGFTWSYQDWSFAGYSLAGITTSIYCRNAGVLFDVGQGLPFQMGARHVLITHAHMDHAAGIPYLLSQKNIYGQKETNLLVPEAFAGPLEEILGLWRKVDGHEYGYKLVAARPGELYELDKLHCVRPFATPHRVPSQGYILYRKKTRLRADLRDRGLEEFGTLVQHGADQESAVRTALDREVFRRGVLVRDEPFGRRDEVVEHVLLHRQHAGLVPLLAELAATAVGDLWTARGPRPVSRVVAHSGGRDVLEALAPVVAPHSLAASKRVLRDYGNMSSPSVLFALEKALTAPAPTGVG